MEERFRPVLIILSGFSTLILKQFIPIGGGGVSLIFVLSIPILILLGLVFGFIYSFLSKKVHSKLIKNVVFVSMIFSLVGLSFLFYPYA